MRLIDIQADFLRLQHKLLWRSFAQDEKDVKFVRRYAKKVRWCIYECHLKDICEDSENDIVCTTMQKVADYLTRRENELRHDEREITQTFTVRKEE